MTTNTYLATGQLASLNDAENQTTTYTYNDAGVKLTEQYPDHTGGTPGQTAYGIITFTLDHANRVSVKRDQKGDTCKYIYDFAGRSTTHQYRTLANSPGGVPSGTISDTDSFTFDKASRMLTAVSGRYVNTVTYTYDQAGRKKTEALTISGKTYTTTTAYNTRGEVTGLTYPDGALVNRDYTDRGELWKVKHATVTIDTRTYDNGGRMTASTFNNGVAETRSYGSDNTLTAINFGGTGSAIGSLTYGWDVNKNKTSEVVSGTMSNYGFTIPTSGYDNEDRLVTYNRTSGLNQSWGLSLVSDWNSITTNGTAQSRTHGPTHELLNAAGQAVTTDVKGNITLIPAALRSNGQALAITYDFNNRMVTADVGNNSSVEVSHKYDALGRRVSLTVGSTTTIFALSGQQVICDYASGAAPAASTYRYLYASYIDEPVLRVTTTGSVKIYYHRNQQYSVIALTSSTGAVQERYAYTAYGEPTITNASGSLLTSSVQQNRYLYTGQEWDNVTQQYHFNARTYDAKLGRFSSRDPIGFDGGISFYAYLRNSPTAMADPTGQEEIRLGTSPFDLETEVECEKWYAIHEAACYEIPWYDIQARLKCFEAVEKQRQNCDLRANLSSLKSDLITSCPTAPLSEIDAIIDGLNEAKTKIKDRGGAVRFQYLANIDIGGQNCSSCESKTQISMPSSPGVFKYETHVTGIGFIHGTHAWGTIESSACNCKFTIDFWNNENRPYHPNGNGWTPDPPRTCYDGLPWWAR